MRLYLSGDLSKAHKLHGKMTFQGLPISVENRKGSTRHWHDPHTDTSGSTTFEHPYGYVDGSLGLDGEEVDVFVGPDKVSEKVFVITQMKGPEFTEVDEQKVMLGFSSVEEAKAAYLRHYDNEAFFGAIKELSLGVFNEMLISHKGQLIKHLLPDLASANIQRVDVDRIKKGNDMAEVEKSCEHDNKVTCEKCNGTHSTQDILKGLTSRMLSMMTPRREAKPVVSKDPEFQTTEVQLFGVQVGLARHVDRPFEPPLVPVVAVPTPAQAASPLAPDFMTSCGGCGYTHKSLGTCPRCDGNKAADREATPIWRR